MDFGRVDELVAKAIEGGVFPGAAYAVGNRGKVVHRTAMGRHTYCPDSKETETDTMWDLASVSKVVGTTSGAMKLIDDGKLKFDMKVSDILPEFAQNDKSNITVENLLLHNSGLAAFHGYQNSLSSSDQVFAAIFADKLVYPTGTKMVYSDLGMITFGKIVEVLSGRTFTAFLNEHLFQPLGMKNTTYSPVTQLRSRCAPTDAIEPWRTKLRVERGTNTPEIWEIERQPDGASWITGEVHDPNAMVMNGVAGHAGLFSTLDDLCKFMQAMLKKDSRIASPETISLFTRRQSDNSSRGLGWDTNWMHEASAGQKFSEASFGHTGYTGTSVWGDFENETYVVLLTNRVNPTSQNTKIIGFRPKFHDAVYEAIHA